jgi:hypothetical protein
MTLGTANLRIWTLYFTWPQLTAMQVFYLYLQLLQMVNSVWTAEQQLQAPDAQHG